MVETCPTCDQEIKSNEKKTNVEDLRKVITAWKILNGISVEGDESKRWDRAHFGRLSKTAKRLLNLLGSPQDVLNCMDYVMKWCQERKLDFTLETVLKRSDTYLEVKK